MLSPTLEATASAIVLTALAVVALLLAERRGSRALIWLAKPAASLGFLAVAWLAGALEHDFGQRVFVGLVCCALGDVLLIPLGAGPAFLAGMASFALGHGVYAWAFATRAQQLTAALLAAAGMIALLFFVLRWLGPKLPPDMRVPVRVYMVVIAGMVVAAVSASAGGADVRIALGAVAFALSDLSVARERFVQPQLLNLLWGLPLYYLAQVLLALSAAAQ
jgi:uncharacterized membrane protein YhhN